MFFFRLILAFASPEFRNSYGDQLRHDVRAGLTDPERSRAYITHMYVDLLLAIFAERTNMILRQFTQAIRSFARTPAITTVMILTLALGIGANVAAFSIASGVLLHPLPFGHPERIVSIYRTTYINSFHCTTCPHSESSAFTYRDESRSFDALAPFASWAGVMAPLQSSEQPRNVSGTLVGEQFFDVVDVRPKLGRLFVPADERPQAPPVVVASYQFWQTALHGDPHAIGRTFFLDAKPFALVGVLAPDFIFPAFYSYGAERPSLYFVLRHSPGLVPGNNAFGIIARTKPGISEATAQADLMLIQAGLNKKYPASYSSNGRIDPLRIISLNDGLFGPLRPLLIILLCAVFVVLIIACLNVANLLLARAVARRRDMMLRVAIGATRRHVVTQIVWESAVLAAISAIAGLAIAHYAVIGYVRLAPPGMHRLDQITIDIPVYLYAVAVAIATALITSAVPIFVATRSSIASILKSGDRAARGGAGRIRNALVIAQIACAFALIVSSGLLVRSFIAVTSMDMGYETSHLAEIITSGLPAARYRSVTEKLAFYRQLQSRLAAIPGIARVAYGSHVPFDGNDFDGDFQIAGHNASQAPDAHFLYVSPGYFETLGVHALAGRTLQDRDGQNGAPVAVVNAEFAKEFLSNGGAIGRHLVRGTLKYDNRAIVGIVPNVEINNVSDPLVPTMYFPNAQSYLEFGSNASMLFRITVPLASLTPSIAAAWRATDSALPPPAIYTVHGLIEQAGGPSRASAILLGALALLGFVLAVSGTVSVVAYNIARRTNEIGLRMALGAKSARVTRTMLTSASLMTVTGIGIGFVVATFTSRALTDQLFKVAPFDPITYAVVAATLAIATLVSSFVPVYRASKIDPAKALRYE
jgi:putative ABC transport system permease protein